MIRYGQVGISREVETRLEEAYEVKTFWAYQSCTINKTHVI